MLAGSELHTMMCDLGMLTELTGDYLVRLATDIEEWAKEGQPAGSGSTSGTSGISSTRGVSYSGGVGGDSGNPNPTPGTTADPASALQQARERGRRLLRYLKKGDGSAELLNAGLCRRLSKVRFVPMEQPLGVEPGGHVVYGEWRQGARTKYAYVMRAYKVMLCRTLLDLVFLQ